LKLKSDEKRRNVMKRREKNGRGRRLEKQHEKMKGKG